MNLLRKMYKYLLRNKKPVIFVLMVIVLSSLLFTLRQGSGSVVRNSDSYYAQESDFLGANSMSIEMAAPLVDVVSAKRIEAPVVIQEAEYDQQIERKLIKNGSLSLTVTSIDQARVEIQKLVSQLDGFIAQENFSQGQNYGDRQRATSRSGSLTIRVPNENFEKIKTGVRGLALIVTNEYTNISDVTERHTDLKTRLENKLEEEKQYRAILTEAKKVSEILEVTRYIEQARSEAERLQGQLNVLDNQITLSTLEVYLESEKQYELGGVSWSPIDNLKESYRTLINGLTTLVDFAVSLLVILPLLALYGVLAWFVFTVLRKLYKKVFAK